MSTKLSIATICKNSDRIWHKIRWSEGEPVCMSCGCDQLYYLSDGRYKCKHCGKIFSDRTGTILQNSRLPIQTWLIAIFKFAVCKECSAIDLKKECGCNYKTAYMILQKLRYLVGKEDIKLEGILKIDEAYIGAEWKNVHMRKKMTYMKENGYLDSNNRYTKRTLLQAVSNKKYHILSITDEHNRTRLIHCPNPITKSTIKTIIETTNATGIVSDESSLYNGLGVPVYQSNHSRRIFLTSDGLSSNVCENRFSWTKRKLNGVFASVSEKYLQFYLWQRQFQVNNCELTDENKFTKLCYICSKHKVTQKNITDFDYKARFPRSRRELAQEEARTLLQTCGGLVSSVTDSYGRTYH